MVKKTKLRKIKGGKTTLEKLFPVLSVEGPFIPENVDQRVKLKHEGPDLEKEYRERKEIADIDYKLANNEYENEDEKNRKKADRDFKYNKLHKDDIFRKLKLFVLVIHVFVVRVLGKVIEYVFKIATFILSFGASIGKALGNGVAATGTTTSKVLSIGKGAIIKFLLLLLFIALIIGLTTNLFGNKGSPSLALANNNSNNKLDFMVNSKQTGFLSDFSNTLNSIIPDKYKIQFTSFRNSINKAMGNDIIANSIDNQPRESINEGRYNGITNIKKKSDDVNIYNIFKPKDKSISINLDEYKDSDIDFYKLPEGVRKEIITKNKTFMQGNTFKIDFNNKQVLAGDGKTTYKYEINKTNNNIPIKTDPSIYNHFIIESNPINPIRITEKDIQKNRNNYMFTYKDGNFNYPS